MDDSMAVTYWQTAWAWVRHQRRNAPANAGIWHLLFHRKARDQALYASVVSGLYRLTDQSATGPAPRARENW